MKITKENIGEILQNIYDSEINIAIGYCWDGGFSFSLQPDIYLEKTKFEIETSERNIEDAFLILIEEIEKKYGKEVINKIMNNKKSA